MKLRLQDGSVRLRLTKPEVALIGRGVRVQARSCFPNGEVFTYALAVTAGEQVTARYDDECIEVQIPRRVAVEWASGDAVSIAATQPTARGEFSILVEKDFSCLHPRDGVSEEGTFPNPRATAGGAVSSDPVERL